MLFGSESLLILVLSMLITGLIGGYIGVKIGTKFGAWLILKQAHQNKSRVNYYRKAVGKKLLDLLINGGIPGPAGLAIQLIAKSREGSEFLDYATRTPESTVATLDIALKLAAGFATTPQQHQEIMKAQNFISPQDNNGIAALLRRDTNPPTQ